ncbi:MAG: hypothetical protein J7L28_00120 [Thermotogae bacterium]|nr:hypothetical protein [Thermotogota bacterium]
MNDRKLRKDLKLCVRKVTDKLKKMEYYASHPRKILLDVENIPFDDITITIHG